VDLALALLYLGDTRNAESWLAHAVEVFSSTPDAPEDARGRLAFAQFLHCFARGDFHTARHYAERAVAILDRAVPGAWSQLRGGIAYVRVASAVGDLDAAEAMYERTARELSARGPLDTIFLPMARCELELTRGHLGEAATLAARAIEAAAAVAGALDPITADAHYVLGTVLLERNEVAVAEAELRTGMQLGEMSGYIHSSLYAALSLVRAWHALGRRDEAWSLLEALRDRGGRAVPPLLTERIDAASARLALLDGDLAAARAHAGAADRNRRARLVARVLAEAGDRSGALHMANQVVPVRIWDRLDVLLVRARCLPRPDERLAALRDAVTLGEREGYVRVFVDEGRWISEPLRELVASWPTPYVAELVTALVNEPAPPSTAASGPLSDREIEVWRYLSTPLSTREIADALFISRNTLKSHLRSIYRKLGVSTRQDAVARGHERLGVQSPRVG
jgi:LuxR family maltose regulon positive regulatory protein